MWLDRGGLQERIELNVVLSLVPLPLTTAMIATEMPAAIRPYSMAVAPNSSFRNDRNVASMLKHWASIFKRSVKLIEER